MSFPENLLKKYDSVEYLDHGGYGQVYKCTRGKLITAVKVLEVLDLESQKRFQSEVDILQRIEHAHVVKLLDAGITDECYWYESEFASQGHFGQMQGYLFYSDLDKVDYFSQICLGVQALHEFTPPIIHRDLKPSNILVFESEKTEQRSILKVADFGLATIVGSFPPLTTTGKVVGTAHYIAPEREKNPRIKTPQSDIYSLGVTFLEACTGRTRPSTENLELVPNILKPVIQKMVREYPVDRYQTVAEVLEALNNLPFDQLFFGRKLGETESIGFVAHVNIGGELENALELLLRADNSNVLERLGNLERTLDRLGDAPGHEAIILMNIPSSTSALIEEADRSALLRIVHRFDNAINATKDDDFFCPSQSWFHFLSNTFHCATLRATKAVCLDGLAYCLKRFDSPYIKHILYQTIISIDDPSYMEELAGCLSRINRKDIADLLKGAPHQQPIDCEALKAALFKLR